MDWLEFPNSEQGPIIGTFISPGRKLLTRYISHDCFQKSGSHFPQAILTPVVLVISLDLYRIIYTDPTLKFH